jgi:hypothetical protein
VCCRVAKVVAPKKAALKQAEAEYAILMEGLAAKKAELAAVVAALDALNDKLAAMQVRALIRGGCSGPCRCTCFCFKQGYSSTCS